MADAAAPCFWCECAGAARSDRARFGGLRLMRALAVGSFTMDETVHQMAMYETHTAAPAQGRAVAVEPHTTARTHLEKHGS